MNKTNYTEEQLSEKIEYSFFHIKEAYMRLQERTKCLNNVVVKMLDDVAE